MLPDFESSDLSIPVGLEAGYALGGGGKDPVVDLFALFEWPALLVPGSDGDKSLENIWVLAAGARLYFPFGVE